MDDPRHNEGAIRTEYEQKWDSSDILSTLHSFKYMKSVPTDRARKETWQMMIEKSSTCAQFLTTYFNIVWSSMYVPDGWQTSEAVQLDKQNGKKAPRASDSSISYAILEKLSSHLHSRTPSKHHTPSDTVSTNIAEENKQY